MCKGGLRLHKFISNNKEVVESTPMELHTKEIKELDLNHNLLPPKHKTRQRQDKDNFIIF